MLQTRLTPNLGSFIEVIKSELDFALSTEVPECEGKSFVFRILGHLEYPLVNA